MVRSNNGSSGGNSQAPSTEVVEEQLRAVLGLYDRLNQLLREWSERSKKSCDATVLALADFYQELCRELEASMALVQRAAATFPAINLDELRDARRHLAIILAVDAQRILQAEKDIREGRTVTLEQMRRELRNPAH